MKHDVIDYGRKLDKSKSKARIDANDKIIELKNEWVTLKGRWDLFCNTNIEFESTDTCLSEVGKFCNELAALTAKHTELNSSCEYLGVQSMDPSPLQALHTRIVLQAGQYEMIKEFNHSITLMGEEQWKKVQSKRLEEYVMSWKGRFDSVDASVISQQMLKTLSVLESILSLVSHCCGEIYSDEHWAELFYEILEIPVYLPVSEVTLNKVMNCSNEVLLAPGTLLSLKNLSKR